MAANYYKIISNLIQWNDRLSDIKDEKLQSLIQVLKKYDYNPDPESEEPTSKDLAREMGIPYPKVNLQLRKLYQLVIEGFYDKPLKPKYVEQHIAIHISFPESWNMEKELKKRMHDHSFWLMVDLDYIPKIGEEINIDFIELDDRFTHGYVHNVSHTFRGCIHEIIIEVHPFDNEYTRWKKMEERYNWKQRIDRQLKSKRDNK